jgi:hypothetical protein
MRQSSGNVPRKWETGAKSGIVDFLIFASKIHLILAESIGKADRHTKIKCANVLILVSKVSKYNLKQNCS